MDDFPRYYRRDGTRYPPGNKGLIEWGRDFENHEKRIVAFDELSNGVEVSTVWLGLDHSETLRESRRPIIFETMLFFRQKKTTTIFGRTIKTDREPIGELWRYSTEEEARRGHKMLVKKWSKFKSATQLLKEIRQEKSK